MEIWKDIEGYEGLYQVSNEGRVKSLQEVEQYTLNGELVETFKSASEVERKNPQFKTSSITRCCRNNKAYKGYIWKYKKG